MPFILIALVLAQRPDLDLAQMREVLEDRQDPRGQSQAALLLVQSSDPGAEKLVRAGLRQTDNEEMFFALATAVRLQQDARFLDDLLAALHANRVRLRQALAETLAVLPNPDLVKQLHAIATDTQRDLRVRQTAVWAMGRSGRHVAADSLVQLLDSTSDDLRRVVTSALGELSGQNYGSEVESWRAWWQKHKNLSNEQWLQLRANFQATRAVRLEGELGRARAQILNLHQQLYARLPLNERLSYVQLAADQEDAGTRGLAIIWCLDLLGAPDPARQKIISTLLLRLTKDSHTEVQRAAVLALGRVADSGAFERLVELMAAKAPGVRAAAARGLSLATRGDDPVRQKRIIAALQKSLEDSAPEVVIESAEALGALGAPEAGPVLTGLLRHPAEHVRQTAAQALERTADISLLDGLLKGLDDLNVTVRFGVVGAIGRAAGNGQALTPELRRRLLGRLEVLLKRDPDQGVRSRAATVLGEVGGADALPLLWAQVQASGEGRVQEKAWDAFVEAVGRGTPDLLREWDTKLNELKQQSRRVQLLAKVYARWDQQPATRTQASKALEALIAAEMDEGKWAAAAPLVGNLLGRADVTEALRERSLKWTLRMAELALKDGNAQEANRVLQLGRAHLASEDILTEAFDAMEKRVRE